MSNIEQMRRQRAELNDQVQKLAGKSKSEKLTAEEAAQFDQMIAEAEYLTSEISRLEKAEKLAADASEPVKEPLKAKAPAVHLDSEIENYKGAKAARTVMAIAAGKGNQEKAAAFAADKIGDKDVAMAIETSAASGGALIPQNVASEVIELLRPKTVVRALGAQSVPLPNGNNSLPRLSGGAQSSYVGEGSDVLATEASLDDVKLSAKTMITLVPISNQMIGHTGRRIESIVLNDMISSMAIREDKAFLRDDGTSSTPTGFRKVATDASRTLAWTGTADLATIDAYLDSLILKLMESDSMLVSPGWAMCPRSYMKLFGLRDGNGNKVYPEMAQGQLKGWPIRHTTTIPNNLGAGTDEAEIYFADWNDVVIGENEMMEVDFSREATYKDSGGNLVSAFARNQSVIRVVTEHDVGFRHEEGLILGNAVTW